MIVGHVDHAVGVLADRTDSKGEPIAGPGLLVDGEQRGVVGARGREPGFDTADGLLAPEMMRDRDDKRLRHDRFPGSDVSFDMGERPQSRQPAMERSRTKATLSVNTEMSAYRS